MDHSISQQSEIVSFNFDYLLRLMQEGQIVLSPSGYVVDVGETATRQTVNDAGEILGKHFSELY